VKLKALASWIFLSFTSFWRNSDSYEYKNKSARRGAQFVPIASSASFLDIYLEFDDSGQISTKIYDKRDDFNFKIINFPNMCSNILYTFSLYENPSFIIFSAETEYISTRSWYRNINFLRDRIRRNFFRNACTKSGSLRFSQFSGCWLILSVYILMSFDFPFVRLFGIR
jgi:hypothetical protein